MVAVVFTFFVCKLFEKFVGKDILDVSQYVGGNVLKFLVGISYIITIILICATLLQYFAESLKILYFPNTPIYLIIFIFLAGAIIANHAGNKAINNLNTIIVPIRPNKHAYYFYFNRQKF